MRTAFCTLTMLVMSATAHAEAPQGPDAIHGAFARMFEHESAGLAAHRPAGGQDDAFVEQWVNSTAREDWSAPEAGFVHMLARCSETPRLTPTRGEPDALAVMIASALQSQRQERVYLAGASGGRTAP
jgi:hypothetical protein